MSYINYKEDEIDYEKDHITSSKGIVTPYNVGENEYETASRRMHNQQYFQHKPTKEIGLFRLIDKIQRLVSKTELTPVKSIYSVKANEKIKLGGKEIDRVYFPENSFYSYLIKQDNLSEKTIEDLRNIKEKMNYVAKNICKKKKGLEGKTHEVLTALFYDDFLKKMFAEETEIKDAPKKYKIKDLSEASQLSMNKIKYWTSKIRETYSQEIFNYKQKNNLLTYQDLKEFNKGAIDKIKNEVNENKNQSFSSIAKRYGLKNSKVISKIVLEDYLYDDSILNEKFENLLQIA